MTAMVGTRHLFDLHAVTEPSLAAATPSGTLSTNLVREGTVRGERICGRILPGGGDWMVFDTSVTGHVDARIVIETDDGALVHAVYAGRLVFRGDARQRLRAGAALDEADTYFRIAPTFAAPESYGWMNNIQAVGIGRLAAGPDRTTIVEYRVFEVT